MSTSDDDPRLKKAIELFNQQEFFACHDELEEIWSETVSEEKTFLQGLIHAAVALFHFSEGNLGGARKMHDSAVAYLSPFKPHCLGIDLETFLVEFDHCFELLLGEHSSYPSNVLIDDSLIPQIKSVTK